MEKFYLSKTLLELAGGGGCIPHIPPLDPPLKLAYSCLRGRAVDI